MPRWIPSSLIQDRIPPIPASARSSSDYADDPTAAELKEAIDDLNDDEVIDLIAMVWVGRGDFGRSEWQGARDLARERHRQHSADYLMGIPTLGDLLEEGMSQLGYSCAEYDLGHL